MNKLVHVCLHECPRYINCCDITMLSGVDHACQHNGFNCDCWCTCILFVDVCTLTSTICTAMTFDSPTPFLLEEHKVSESGTSFFMGKVIDKLGFHDFAIMKLLHFCQDGFNAHFSKDFQALLQGVLCHDHFCIHLINLTVCSGDSGMQV